MRLLSFKSHPMGFELKNVPVIWVFVGPVESAPVNVQACKSYDTLSAMEPLDH